MFFLLLFSHLALAGPLDWKVTQPKWTSAHEKKFSEFVAQLGESRCRNLNDCLTSTASNPFYANRTPRSIRYFSDCADLPYSLRAYFAWMEGLPFDYVSEVAPVGASGGDIRYSKNGNRPTAWRKLTFGNTYNAGSELANLRGNISTAMYRMLYTYVSDFYPVALDRNNIRPGTVVYDPSGHAAIVYKIENDGRVRMMDAHPDQSMTRITFDKKFVRSRPEHGAGFKNWRPELDGRPSAQLPGYSTEEFNKTFKIGNQVVSYYDYIRNQMAGGNLKYQPVDELKSMMSELCANIQDRVAAVDAAIQAGIQNKSHPPRLPNNIYGTNGEWEEFSTPSRDARLKVAFVELRQAIEEMIHMYERGSDRVNYTPVKSKYSDGCSSNNNRCFLIASLLQAYEEGVGSAGCQFAYKNSEGRAVRLDFTAVLQRLYALSFDPYHCVELRWGASDNAEMASCRDNREKSEWYSAEQNLRNQLERTYSQVMGTDLAGTRKLGVPQQTDADLWAYLRRELRN